MRDLAGGHRHELTENMRSDPGQLREVAAGRRGGVLHAGAGQAKGALSLQARVAEHDAGHQPQQAHGRERSGEPRPGAGGPTNGCSQTTQNSPQSLRVWPGPAERYSRASLAVAEVEPDGVRLDNGMRCHPAEPRSYLGPHPPPRPPGPRVLPPHAAPPVRVRLAGHELRVQEA